MNNLICIAALFAMSAMAHEGGHENPDKEAEITGEVILGEGKYQYKNTPHWGEIPEASKSIGWTHGGVVVDSQGHVYVSSNQDNTIIIYKKQGEILRQFGKQWKGIHSMLLRKEKGKEYIYAARLWGSEIIKFHLDGSVAMKIDAIPPHEIYKNPDNKYKLTAVAVSANGDIFAADGYGMDLIHKYDSTGKYLMSFGGKGKGEQYLNNAHGLLVDVIDGEESLLVCDRGNRKIKQFNLEGQYLKTVNQGLQLPGLIVRHGELYAVTELKGGVVLLDQNFKFIVRLGENPKPEFRANFNVEIKDWKAGYFTAPHSCVFDQEGSLYVSDWNKYGRIQKFVRVK